VSDDAEIANELRVHGFSGRLQRGGKKVRFSARRLPVSEY